jgi:hypothetical protein
VRATSHAAPARRCSELERLAERAAAEGQAQRELLESTQRELLDRLAAAQAAAAAAAGEGAAAAGGARDELRAREAELVALRQREAEAERDQAARVAALEEAHAAQVAALEEAHAARIAALESGRRILLQGGDDKARLKEEVLRLHQELYSTQAEPAPRRFQWGRGVDRVAISSRFAWARHHFTHGGVRGRRAHSRLSPAASAMQSLGFS